MVERVEKEYVDEIHDHAIYNFWVGDNGTTNPHKFYGYLDSKAVCSVIAGWMMG